MHGAAGLSSAHVAENRKPSSVGYEVPGSSQSGRRPVIACEADEALYAPKGNGMVYEIPELAPAAFVGAAGLTSHEARETRNVDKFLGASETGETAAQRAARSDRAHRRHHHNARKSPERARSPAGQPSQRCQR